MIDRDRAAWQLEGLAEDARRLSRVAVKPLPFRVGRASGLGLVLRASAISHHHAEIFLDRGRLRIRDLGSTNGTFVNGRRITGEHPLADGDTLHFAEIEFRLSRLAAGEPEGPATMKLPAFAPPEALVEQLRLLPELLARGAVEAVFQPIVALPSAGAVAYEALGRGRHPGLPSGPGELFALAARVGLAVELCQLFRSDSAAAGRRLPAGAALFVNSRPEELRGDLLVTSCAELRRLLPDRDLVVEIHESAVTDLGTIRRLRVELAALGVRLAYDDFGAGQARLVELAEAPPDYLKFDFALVHGVDQAPGARQRLLATLVSMADDLGIATIAEGVETAREAAACRQLGFTHGQGNFFGAPQPADEIE